MAFLESKTYWPVAGSYEYTFSAVVKTIGVAGDPETGCPVWWLYKLVWKHVLPPGAPFGVATVVFVASIARPDELPTETSRPAAGTENTPLAPGPITVHFPFE